MIRFLRHDNQWPRFRRFGFEVDSDSGALSLRRLPGPPVEIGFMPESSSSETRRAGIAVGANGVVYLSAPATRHIHRLEPGCKSALPFLSLEAAGETSDPLSLAFDGCRNRLLIADAAHHSIRVVDAATGQVVAVWGRTLGVDSPEQIACDRDGNVFVLDRDVQRPMLKITSQGEVDAAFTDTTAAALQNVQIAARLVTCGFYPAADSNSAQQAVFLVVQDAPDNHLLLFIFDSAGQHLQLKPISLLGAAKESAAPLATSVIDSPLVVRGNYKTEAPARDGLRGVAVIDTMLFVGINEWTGDEGDRIWCFEIGDNVAGAPRVEPSWLTSYQGPVSALTVRGGGDETDLLVHGGSEHSIVALRRRGAFRTQGAFLAGPFTGYSGRSTPWHRLRMIGKFPEGCRCQFFTLSRNEEQFSFDDPVRIDAKRLPNWYRVEAFADLFSALRFAPAMESAPSEEIEEIRSPRQAQDNSAFESPERVEANTWSAVPEGQIDFLLRNSGGGARSPADQLWILGLVSGNGFASPAFVQARLEFDEEGWLADLPACYSRSARDRSLLRSLLAFIECAFEEATEGIDRLPALFSPDMVTQIFGRGSPELGWLATALALPLPGVRDDTERVQQMFRDGPHWLARRGTPEGFRRLIWLETGIKIHLDEPGLELPSRALANAGNWTDAIGYASLDKTASPALASDLAHHFIVRGYEVDIGNPDARAALERAVHRFAPAHATWSIQVIEPTMRVEIQARLGIDTVLACEERIDPFTLNAAPGPDVQLMPAPPPSATIGDVQLGPDARLS